MTTALTSEQVQARRKRLEAARDRALKDLDTLFSQEKSNIWADYYKGLDLLGLDKNGKLRRTQ